MVRIKTQTYDQAVEHYQQTKTSTARRAVWNYINQIPALYFVQCGLCDKPVPWIVFDKEVPTAMVFTEKSHAMRVAKQMIEDKSNVRLIGLPTNAASMYMTAIAAQGVTKVCFNHGPKRFDASMDEVLLTLCSMHRDSDGMTDSSSRCCD